MSIATLEEDELPEHYMLFELTHNRKPADSTGQVVLCEPGHHPKCRLVYVKLMTLVYGAADAFMVEDGDGNDAIVSLAQGTAIGISVEATLIEGQVFERNEAICVNLTGDGGATEASIMTLLLESIH